MLHPKVARPRGSAVTRLPPRPAKLPAAPLTDWYIGARPLDPRQPLRVQPPLHERPQSAVEVTARLVASTSRSGDPDSHEEALEPSFVGIEIFHVAPPPPALLAPPPSSPTHRKRQLENTDSPFQPTKSKTKGGLKNRASTVSAADIASEGRVFSAESLDLDEGLSPLKRAELGRGRGVGRGRGRGRGRGGGKPVGEVLA